MERLIILHFEKDKFIYNEIKIMMPLTFVAIFEITFFI